MEEDLRAALEATDAAQRAADRILSTMNHELRTPLQTVLGFSDFLLAEKEGPLTPGQADDVDAISRAARRMIALIDQTLILARLQAGEVVLAREPVDLPAVVESVRQDAAPLGAAKDLALIVDLPATLPPALGDAAAMRQILLSLIDNAITYTERGTVRISAESSRTNVAVSVSDTGVGIPPELEARVLAELREWTSGLPRRDGGTGLGLAIATRLAEQQGGSISVVSEPGIGSTFTLHLPAAKRRGSSRRTARTVKRG
jgi:signal transduction histidine kinase